jgi:Holliday junction resolvase-like predicted endonuclease
VPLRDVPPEILLAVAAFATLAALFVLAREALVRAARHRTIRLRRERGAAGEARAESLLTALGYTVVGRQVTARYGLGVDGEAIDVTLRADYVVERDDRRFVAEVKTGRAAPRLDTPATRRQLLEYRIAFDVTGVLLVDAEADAVRTVTFPLPAERGDATGRLAWLAVGVALGLASATAMLRN